MTLSSPTPCALEAKHSSIPAFDCPFRSTAFVPLTVSGAFKGPDARRYSKHLWTSSTKAKA